ncbi:MAG: CaiB/BaiF CoA transferase family protein [Lutispora sp.]
MSITGQKDGEPTRVGTSIGDIVAGLFTAIGILAALNYRKETGIGQKVDVAMLDCQVAILENAISRYVVTGNVPKPEGNRHPSIVPFEPFDAKDGKVMVAVGNDVLWEKFCYAIEAEELLEVEEYKTNPSRNEHYEELRPKIAEKMTKKTVKEWLDILENAGVPNGPINTVDKVLEDPQVLARNMIVEVEHEVAGKLKIPGVPIKMSETQGEVKKAAPVLGNDTDEIISELLGMNNEEIEQLKQKGIL